MSGVLSVEQLMLLNNLMYLSDPYKSLEGNNYSSVRQWINDINLNSIDESKNYHYTSGEEWKNIIEAVRNDETLMNMKIVTTHKDSAGTGGGGFSAVFENPVSHEAVVAFKGTAAEEWKDDFIGGGVTTASDGVSTPQQQNALDWYQNLDTSKYSSITVTGHSKGGNKAKYITVMDDSIDRCVSFDGQGFSDEFIEKYSSEIANNQSKISNNNLDGDFVNILLNDIGETTYYKGYGVGNSGGNYAENHCPNSFLNFAPDGTFTMDVGPQSENMKDLDKFINSLLRSMPPDQKSGTLAAIGQLVELGLGQGVSDPNEYLDVLTQGTNSKDLAYVVAYTVAYVREYPDMADTIQNLLSEMGMEDFVGYVDTIQTILDWKYFDSLLGYLGDGLDNLPDWSIDLLLKYLDNNGIHLSKEQLATLLNIVSNVSDYLDEGIDVTQSGDDIKIKSSSEGSNLWTNNAGSLKNIGSRISNLASQLDSINKDISRSGSMGVISFKVKAMVSSIEKESNDMILFSNALEKIACEYNHTEETITSNASIYLAKQK